MTDVPPEPGTIIEFIERDHNVIRGLVGQFDRTDAKDWGTLYRELADYLTRHEVAEQEVVYPVLLEAVDGGEPIVEACRTAERHIELLLAAMGTLSPLDPDFRDQIGNLRDLLDDHIAHEELIVIPSIRSVRAHDDPDFAKRYEVAREGAPSRPGAVADAE